MRPLDDDGRLEVEEGDRVDEAPGEERAGAVVVGELPEARRAEPAQQKQGQCSDQSRLQKAQAAVAVVRAVVGNVLFAIVLVEPRVVEAVDAEDDHDAGFILLVHERQCEEEGHHILG